MKLLRKNRAFLALSIATATALFQIYPSPTATPIQDPIAHLMEFPEKLGTLIPHENVTFQLATARDTLQDSAIEKINYLVMSQEDRLKSKWLLTSISLPADDLKKPLKKRKFFINHEDESYWGHFFENIYLLFPGITKKPMLAPLSRLYAPDPVSPRREDPAVQWIGHSSCLIQMGDLNILTDPVYGFVPPLYKRHTPPGIERKDLPLIDAVLISHNHADHTDEKTLKYLSNYDPYFLVPENLVDWFRERKINNVHESPWWQEVRLASPHQNKEVIITSVPAVHWSQRTAFDGNHSHWAGYVLQYNGYTIYYMGDTAYDQELFDQVKAKFGHIDLAMIPIAPEEEESRHLNLEQALKATLYLNVQAMIPIHWGAYRTGTERIEDPLDALEHELSKNSTLAEKVKILKLGQIYRLPTR